jgi:hypothetical protein
LPLPMSTSDAFDGSAPNDVRLQIAKAAAVFSAIVAAVYAALRVEPSAPLGVFLTAAPTLAVILWLVKDARRTGVGAVTDLGYFLVLAWPIVIPWYALKTRGSKGWALVGLLFGLILAPYIGQVLGAIFVALLRAMNT